MLINALILKWLQKLLSTIVKSRGSIQRPN